MDGASTSTASSIASHNKIGDAFLEAIATSNPELAAKWGTKWTSVPEEFACANEIHEFNATFLTSVYVIPKGKTNAGKHLLHDSALDYWSGMIYDIKKRFQHSTEQSTKVSSRACAAYACLPAERAPAASAARACAVHSPLLCLLLTFVRSSAWRSALPLSHALAYGVIPLRAGVHCTVASACIARAQSECCPHVLLARC